MKHSHKARPRDGKRARKKKSTSAASDGLRSRHIPPFGDVPLVRRSLIDDDGREREWFVCDPDFAPPLPAGAVRGDVRKQEFCTMCHDPRYYYLDDPRVCVQCGGSFVFGAAEQKHWYETLKFHFSSVATRCLACRRKRRSQRVLDAQLVAAKQRVQQSPELADAQLALAEALVRRYQQHQTGSLNQALAASRKARRLSRDHAPREQHETLFWEGMAHALAGRDASARERLSEFVASGISGRRLQALAKEARAWLQPGAT